VPVVLVLADDESVLEVLFDALFADESELELTTDVESEVLLTALFADESVVETEDESVLDVLFDTDEASVETATLF